MLSLKANPCTWKQKGVARFSKSLILTLNKSQGRHPITINIKPLNDNFTNRKTSLICIQIVISYHINLMTLLFLALPEYKIQIYKLQKDSKYGTFITFSMDPVMNRITFVKV